MTLNEIVNNYNDEWPKRPPLVYSHGWIYGVWMIGNDYRNKTDFYGAYPNGLLKRLEVMFGTEGKILHLFSGSLPKGNYTRFDMIEDAEVKGDAHELSTYFPNNHFDICYADPPYTAKDAERYGTPMINRFKVVKEIYKILKPEGFLVWLDTTYPMYRKKELKMIGTIGVIRSTNHRIRMLMIFQKVKNDTN